MVEKLDIKIQYEKSQSLETLNNGVLLATKLSKVLHETQKERGMTAGFVITGGTEFNDRLQLQREKTDKQIKELKHFISDENIVNLDIKVQQVLTIIFNTLNILSAHRDSVKMLTLSSSKAIDFYTNLNESMLNTVVEISKTSMLPEITQNIVAYSNFLYYKENAGIERAIGTAIISNTCKALSQTNLFGSLIEKQIFSREFFLKYATDKAKLFYKSSFNIKSNLEIKKMREIILQNKTNHTCSIDPYFWFKNTTMKINNLKKVDDFLEKEIIFNIKKELKSANQSFWIYVFLNLFSLILFIFMTVIMLKLLKSEKRLKAFTDKYIISSTTDLTGKITDASEAFCNISGYTKKELIGKQHNIVRSPHISKEIFKDMWSTIEGGQTWNGKVQNRKKDGTYYWVFANIDPLFDKHGEVEAYISIRLNITDIELLQEEVDTEREDNAQKEKEQDRIIKQQSKFAQMGEMISMIAHQWRQPLSAISAASTAINIKTQIGSIDKNQTIELSKRISEYAQHLSTTIDDFRDFFKPNKEKSNTTYNELILSVLNIVEISISNKNIQLVKNLNSHNKFLTYPNEIKQVILNLIKNAEDILLEKEIKNPQITIETKSSILTVSDNGGGVAENIIEKIFDPYFSTKMQKNGTGLGLYMSKSIIEEHCGGSLSVKNDENGAVFTINLRDNTND